jgi:hypothetical protein
MIGSRRRQESYEIDSRLAIARPTQPAKRKLNPRWHQPRKTCSTTFPRLLPPNLQIYGMNLTVSSALTPSLSQMFLRGGTSGGTYTPGFQGWHWITSRYRVSCSSRGLRRLLTRVTASAATSVDVERVFSKGRILLSHLRSRLSVQSTRALMCVGAWSLLGYVKDRDVRAATALPEIIGDDSEEELDRNWDAIAFE